MFVGSTSHLTFTHCLSPKLTAVIAEVLQRIASPLEDGRYDLQGDSAFFLVMSDHTQLLAHRKSECHRRYLDVQLLLEGTETFGYGIMPFAGLDEDYLDEKDLAFSEQLQGEERFVTIRAGEFIVFYPGEPHRPLVAAYDDPAPVRKVVIKVDKALFE